MNNIEIIINILFALIIFLLCVELFSLRAVVKVLEKWILELGAGNNKISTDDIKGIEIGKIFKVKKKGFVIMPTEDADEIREAIIKTNQAQGRDTKVSDII
jgi:hypothetical protein